METIIEKLLWIINDPNSPIAWIKNAVMQMFHLGQGDRVPDAFQCMGPADQRKVPQGYHCEGTTLVENPKPSIAHRLAESVLTDLWHLLPWWGQVLVILVTVSVIWAVVSKVFGFVKFVSAPWRAALRWLGRAVDRRQVVEGSR